MLAKVLIDGAIAAALSQIARYHDAGIATLGRSHDNCRQIFLGCINRGRVQSTTGELPSSFVAK